MKKIVILAGIVLGAATVGAVAEDMLKNSLMPASDAPARQAVDLDNLNVAAKPVEKPAPRVSRPGSTVIGTVDGHEIYKKNADEFLKMATKGKVSDFDLLPKQQQSEVVTSLALPVLVEVLAGKEVPADIKKKLVAQHWVGQEMKKTTVSEDEMKKFYEENKKVFKDKSGKELEYDKVKNYISMTIKQQKFSKELMKNAKIEVK
jgi:hypothetical protein